MSSPKSSNSRFKPGATNTSSLEPGGSQAVMHIAIYARVSTSGQDCAMQLRKIREYAARQGSRVHDGYIDRFEWCQELVVRLLPGCLGPTQAYFGRVPVLETS